MEAGVPALSATEVSESFDDEREDDVDDGKDDLVEGKSERRKSQQGDDGDAPGLEDAV